MKKLLLLALVAATAGTAQAQSIAAGTTMLTGNVGYASNTDKLTNTGSSTSTTTTYVNSSFTLGVMGGYFVADNLAIGLSLEHRATGGSSTYSGPGNVRLTDPLNSATWRVGPFVQYYKMLSEQFAVAGTLSGGYQNDRLQQYGNVSTYEQTRKGYYAAITPSVVFFPIPKLAFNASIGGLGYNRLNVNDGQSSNLERISSSFGANFGLNQLLFGGTYYFGR